MSKKLFFTKDKFDYVKSLSISEVEKLQAIAEMIRINILSMVMIAGSGHLGASLSATDVITVLYHAIMNVVPNDSKKEDRDIFLLSKGHAAPALYSVLASLGFFPDDYLSKFRRLKGLEGHVDIVTPGIEGNFGSLGMGISKGKGHALAIKKKGLEARVFVMVGDGELQEGQNWEGLQSASTWALGNLILLIDRNMIQSDKLVDELLAMPPIEEKIKSFGWQVEVVNGHDVKELTTLFRRLDYSDDNPKAVILQTIKGKGVSFMEYPYELKVNNGIYRWHNRIPEYEEYTKAINEINLKIRNILGEILKITSNFYITIPESFKRQQVKWTNRSVVDGFSEALQELCQKNKKIISLDSDLAADIGLRPIEENYPEQFLEVGIAEQDSVSIAAGLARQGFLPIVNSFAAFLTSRANEQIFNNETEGGKIIYVGHLAGLIPATPGKSHQAVRDIALMRTMPNLVIFEPCNFIEAKIGTKFLIEEIDGSAYLRMASGKGMVEINLPEDYEIRLGKGVVLKEGSDVALISYGPIMLGEALKASEILNSNYKIEVKVINMPWLNRIDLNWLKKNILPIKKWFVIDNHISFGGLGEELKRIISDKEEFKEVEIHSLAVKSTPCSGWTAEVLKYFELDDKSIIKTVIENI